MFARPLLLAALLATAAPAQLSTIAPTYADVADLVLAAPVIADATIRSTVRLKGADAAGLPPGVARFYVEAQVGALVRGAGGLPPRVGYILDAPLDARGRAPSFKKARVLLFARPATLPGQLQLVAPDAQAGWTPALDGQVRAVVREVLAPDPAPRITGVGQAFHVAGAVRGESETQLFLQTADNRPVSISVLRRPGERTRWAVALAEIVDEAAGPPPRDTLLWYRLACFLPGALPARATADASPADAEMARADYAFVLAELGACGRTRGLSGGAAPA